MSDITIKIIARRALLVLSVFALTACGLIKDRSGEYNAAETSQRITVPEGYSDLKIGSRYPIPNVDRKAASSDQEGYELPKPPNATAALSADPYLVESIEDQTWLRLYSSPGKVWPMLDFFWQEQGVKTSQQLIQQGYVMTQAIAESSPLYELVRESGMTGQVALLANLLQGVRRNTAELQVKLVPAGAVLTEASWSKAASLPKVETKILNAVGEFVSSDVQRNRHSLLANDISGEPRVFLLEDDQGGKYLKLNLSYLRSWREVGKALKASEVLVSDIDQSQGKYFVSYLSRDELDSWFSTEEHRQEKAKEHNFSIEISGSALEQADAYEVRVKALNDSFDSNTATELLTIIFEHIS